MIYKGKCLKVSFFTILAEAESSEVYDFGLILGDLIRFIENSPQRKETFEKVQQYHNLCNHIVERLIKEDKLAIKGD